MLLFIKLLLVSKGHKLFISNVSYKTDQEALRRAFDRFGKLTDVFIPLDRSKRPRGIAFVTFENKADASKAVTDMEG
jgi:FUS-interacting serine-arginine-rich protein 1